MKRENTSLQNSRTIVGFLGGSVFQKSRSLTSKSTFMVQGIDCKLDWSALHPPVRARFLCTHQQWSAAQNTWTSRHRLPSRVQATRVLQTGHCLPQYDLYLSITLDDRLGHHGHQSDLWTACCINFSNYLLKYFTAKFTVKSTFRNSSRMKLKTYSPVKIMKNENFIYFGILFAQCFFSG